jgi:hypothetical protein
VRERGAETTGRQWWSLARWFSEFKGEGETVRHHLDGGNVGGDPVLGFLFHRAQEDDGQWSMERWCARNWWW